MPAPAVKMVWLAAGAGKHQQIRARQRQRQDHAKHAGELLIDPTRLTTPAMMAASGGDLQQGCSSRAETMLWQAQLQVVRETILLI